MLHNVNESFVLHVDFVRFIDQYVIPKSVVNHKSFLDYSSYARMSNRQVCYTVQMYSS